MKIIIASCIFLFSCVLCHAQHKSFLRIYNAEGKKIAKGYFVNTTDSSIQLENGGKIVNIEAAQIELIKSKRTIASRILSTAVKTVAGIVIVATVVVWVIPYLCRPHTINNNTPKKDAEPTIKKVKPLKEYRINNNLETWQQQRLLLDRLW